MKTTQEIKTILPIIEKNEPYIGSVAIEKLHIKENLYPQDSPENTIEKHISILKESTDPKKQNSILILAAHSGTGNVAYFKDLNQLEINDKVIINYEHKKYIYYVNEIWEEKKTGYININLTKKRQLILTTCDPINKEYQIVISCIEKESH